MIFEDATALGMVICSFSLFLNASSVANQILIVQSETRTKLGKHLTEDGKAPPEEKTEEQLWQEQAYTAMLEEEDS